MAKKKQTEQKCLSDEELIKKYDKGKINLKKVANAMCQPSPTASQKSEKQTKKR